MFEKLQSCEFTSLAFPHRLTPTAFCLAMFIYEYHNEKIHRGSFPYNIDGLRLFLSIYNCTENDFEVAFDELVKSGILYLDENLWYGLDENLFV